MAALAEGSRVLVVTLQSPWSELVLDPNPNHRVSVLILGVNPPVAKFPVDIAIRNAVSCDPENVARAEAFGMPTRRTGLIKGLVELYGVKTLDKNMDGWSEDIRKYWNSTTTKAFLGESDIEGRLRHFALHLRRPRVFAQPFKIERIDSLYEVLERGDLAMGSLRELPPLLASSHFQKAV